MKKIMKKGFLNNFSFLTVSIILLFSFSSMDAKNKKGEKTCPDEPFYGHIGQVVNTEMTEFRPIFYRGNMLFTRMPKGDKKDKSDELEFRITSAANFDSESQDLSIPMKIIERSAFPSLTIDGKEIYFSAKGDKETKKSRDIFYSFLENGVWSEPTPITTINTKYYESQPAVASDGSYLVFVSDRKDGVGKKDLYITFREGHTIWSEPVSLGQFINSSGDDISPYIDTEDHLYFSSNGHTEKMGFDILRADIKKPGEAPIVLMYPVNTEDDETSCGVYGGKIYVSSDRKNGCGGEDIFSYSICGSAIIQGEIRAVNGLAPREGQLVVENLDNGHKELIEVGDNGKFEIQVEALNSYKIKYSNPCIKKHIVEKIIDIPCSNSSIIKINMNIQVKAIPPDFNFTYYDIPAFSSGYYMPLTHNNIDNLKQKFNYKLIGNSQETKYIAYPKNVSEKSIKKTEIALKDAAGYIEKLIGEFSYGCQAYDINKINVKITGYSDASPLAKGSKYVDATVDDYGIHIEKGSEIDNNALALLRAFYTAKQIEQYLIDNTGLPELAEIVNWQVQSGGIERGKRKIKRHVNIEISVE